MKLERRPHTFDGRPLDLKRGQDAVDPEQVRKDREAELSDIFRREETKRLAAKILALLEEKRELSQKAPANLLKASEFAISRILGPLEEYGLVERVRSGQEKLVRART